MSNKRKWAVQRPFFGISASGTGDIPSLSDFYNYSRTLKNAKLLNEDFQIILFNEARKGDFVYLDPPYAVKNRRIFGNMVRNIWTRRYRTLAKYIKNT
ncbi:MAG: DNA adenine methylase [Candidatus Brocadia sinica]|nr:DNA adenine methylase [Candidatus Brocadia sinica]